MLTNKKHYVVNLWKIVYLTKEFLTVYRVYPRSPALFDAQGISTYVYEDTDKRTAEAVCKSLNKAVK